MDLDDLQRSLDAERAERIDGILSREPADMGMNGACHVVALILKEMFPAYDIVAAKDRKSVKHAGCRSGDKFVDIRGVRRLADAERERGMEFVAFHPKRDGYAGTGLFHDEAFLIAARAKMMPYIQDKRERYDVHATSQNAQQGARANDPICHDSCRATNRASSCRGSSLTLI